MASDMDVAANETPTLRNEYSHTHCSSTIDPYCTILWWAPTIFSVRVSNQIFSKLSVPLVLDYGQKSNMAKHYEHS